MKCGSDPPAPPLGGFASWRIEVAPASGGRSGWSGSLSRPSKRSCHALLRYGFSPSMSPLTHGWTSESITFVIGATAISFPPLQLLEPHYTPTDRVPQLRCEACEPFVSDAPPVRHGDAARPVRSAAQVKAFVELPPASSRRGGSEHHDDTLCVPDWQPMPRERIPSTLAVLPSSQ